MLYSRHSKKPGHIRLEYMWPRKGHTCVATVSARLEKKKVNVDGTMTTTWLRPIDKIPKNYVLKNDYTERISYLSFNWQLNKCLIISVHHSVAERTDLFE